MEPNTQLGNYTLSERLGQGAMADVFMAIQPGVERTVAIKVMHPHLAGREEFSERFQREARAMGRLQHPHIARVIDFDTAQGHDFMVMEFLAGGSLDEYLDAHPGPLPIVEAVTIARQLADALQYAHAQGMVHRDLKPANVMFTDESHRHAVLTDFGIARLADASMTASGIMLGTPAYMAPEQARGERAEAPADQYSLGVVLFEMVTGVQPFTSDTMPGLILSHLNDPIPSARDANPAVPVELDAVITRAMAKDPVDRFRDAGELRAAIEAATRPANFGETTAQGATVVVPAATSLPSTPLGATIASSGRPVAAAENVVPTVVEHPVDPSPVVSSRSANRVPLIAAGAVAVVVAVLAIVLLTRSGGDDAPVDDVAVVDDGEQGAGADDAADAEDPNEDAPILEPTAEEADIGDAGGQGEAGGEAEDAGGQEAPAAEAEVAFTPSFDPAAPPQMFVTSASLEDGRLIVGFDRALRPSVGTSYLAWVDIASGPIGEVIVDDRGLGRLDAVMPAGVATTFRISEEPIGTSPAEPTGPIVYAAGLDAAADTRSDALALAAALVDAEEQLVLAQDHQQLLLDAVEVDDLAEVRRHAEHVVNILAGADGANFGDIDGSGVAENPGDDIGVLGHLETALEIGDRFRSPSASSLRDAVSEGLGLVPAAQRDFLRVIAVDSTGEVDIEQGMDSLADIAATLDDARAAQTSLLALFLVTDSAASDPGTIGLAPVGDAVVVTFGVAADQVEVQFGDVGPTATVIDEFGQATPPIETDQWVSLADAAVRSGDDGAAVLATAEVPVEALDAVSLMLLGDEPILTSLGDQSQVMIDHVDLLLRSLAAGDLGEARRHAEHTVNIIVGSADGRFGDLDGSGVAENPGDDVGVLGHLDRIAELVEAIPVDSDVQLLHLTRWNQAVSGIRDSAEQVVDRVVRVLSSDSTVEAQPFGVEAFASGIFVLDGADGDGNGVIDLFAGELGVRGLARQAPLLLSGPLRAGGG